jgi:phosphate acetyltransferase
MTQALFIAATHSDSGLTSISLGLYHALQQQGFKVGFIKPISLADNVENERSCLMFKAHTELTPPTPLSLEHARESVSEGQIEQLMEDVVNQYSSVGDDYDIIIIEGLVPNPGQGYFNRINHAIAKALDAQVILVSTPGENWKQQALQIEIQAEQFKPRVVGIILNKVGQPSEEQRNNVKSRQTTIEPVASTTPLTLKKIPVLGAIKWNDKLISPRTFDIANYLNATWIQEGENKTRRVSNVNLCARTLANMVKTLVAGSLIVTPGDRHDILLAAVLASRNGVPLAGILFTGGLLPEKDVKDLALAGSDKNLPIMSVSQDSFVTATRLANMKGQVQVDDNEQAKLIMHYVADALDIEKITNLCNSPRESRLPPAAFRYQLVKNARAAQKRIVLPEGEEPRTIAAAIDCQTRGIAHCILLGDAQRIEQIAKAQGLELPSGLSILNPVDIRDQYIEPMLELRKHKGLTAPVAKVQLEDTVVLGTIMLAQGHVDGLVSGAIHTTANTVRPAMQLIKTAANASLVSSVMFMCLPDQVLAYADCAINPDPNAQQLADIAIQTADSAKAMGINPRVAMLSYSTGKSGSGSDVEKVREATAIAKELRPDLIIDGPMQDDAATTASVALSKAPDSPVAGKATVLIFPDLNTGNTTYKAVQRSANVVAIGPMLQGLRKPVNDLSRGSLVEDIIYTIGLTAIQATQVVE